MAEKVAESESAAKFSRLYYKEDDNRLIPLPAWAKFFLELGRALAAAENENFRYAVALALPTRSYAISLIGSGFSLGSAEFHFDENEEHLKKLCSLQQGAPVRYVDRGWVKKARFVEVMSINEEIHIGIQIDEGNNTTIYVHSSRCRHIEPLEQNEIKLPGKQKGKRIQPSSFLYLLLGDRADPYVTRTRIHGVIAGTFSAIRKELQTVLVKIEPDQAKGFGRLNEILRVKGMVPDSLGHRFLFQKGLSGQPTTLPREIAPKTLILFDGANSFSQWKESYTAFNWVVALDRTETNFGSAVDQVNQAYVYRASAKVRVEVPPMPSGVEMMMFAR
jgi:hypothetical protein